MERVTFKRGELTLVGNLYKPEGYSENEKYVALIVQGSATSVKEQMPALYAERLVKEGFVCLAFDYSHYGESDGEPRQLESPDEKVSDLVAATDYLLSLPYVEKVCMVGICSSAQASALFVAKDKQIAALATVAGNFATPDVLKAQMGEKWEQVIAVGRQAREHYEATGESQCVTMYSETDETAANYLPYPGVFDYYLNPNRGNIPAWKNLINAVSFEQMFLADPVAAAKDITVPTLIVHSDGCSMPEQAKAFCAAVASEVKEYADGGGSHFDYYDQDEQVDFAASKISEFFKQVL